MGWVVIAVVIVVVIAIAVLTLSQKQEIQQPEYPYKKIDVLFTPAERSFLGVLSQAVGENAQIFGKVRVADVITPKKGMPRSDWQRAFNKISSKHFDFLLCDKNDLSVLCAIELNDNSHNSKSRKNRDVFLESACRSANVPLIQVSVKATYTIGEVQQSIAPYMSNRQLQAAKQNSINLPNEQQARVIEKLCPKCSSIMVKKTAKKGKNVGKEFWACSAFPKCRHIEPINA